MLRSAVLSIVALLVAGTAVAGIGPGDDVLSFNLGYASGKAAATGTTLDGPVWNFNYENMAWQSPVAFLFSIGWSEISKVDGASSADDGTSLTRQIETWPIYLGAKWYVGTGNLQGHAGAAFGLYYSTVETAVTGTGDEFARWGTSGWGMGVPLGATLMLGDRAFLNGEYFLNWMWSNDAFENDILHTVLIGFGLKLGD